MKTLVFKNYQLIPLANWLISVELPGPLSRSRSRFVAELRDRLTEIEKTKKEIAKKFANLDDKGEMKTVIDSRGVEIYDIPKDKLEEFNKEVTEYLKEDYIMDIVPSNEIDVDKVRTIVLETDETFKDTKEATAASMYEEWCVVFESLPKLEKKAPDVKK